MYLWEKNWCPSNTTVWLTPFISSRIPAVVLTLKNCNSWSILSIKYYYIIIEGVGYNLSLYGHTIYLENYCVAFVTVPYVSVELDIIPEKLVRTLLECLGNLIIFISICKFYCSCFPDRKLAIVSSMHGHFILYLLSFPTPREPQETVWAFIFTCMALWCFWD